MKTLRMLMPLVAGLVLLLAACSKERESAETPDPSKTSPKPSPVQTTKEEKTLTPLERPVPAVEKEPVDPPVPDAVQTPAMRDAARREAMSKFEQSRRENR